MDTKILETKLEERKERIQKQEKKIKTCVKTFKVLNISSYVGFALALAGIGFTIAGKTNQTKAEDLVDTTNYVVYNQEYKIDKADKLLDDLKSGKISYAEFTKAVDNVGDYNVDKFMSENVDKELSTEYKKYRDTEDGLETTGFVLANTAAAVAVGTLIANPITKKKKKNAEDEMKRIDREFFLGQF